MLHVLFWPSIYSWSVRVFYLHLSTVCVLMTSDLQLRLLHFYLLFTFLPRCSASISDSKFDSFLYLVAYLSWWLYHHTMILDSFFSIIQMQLFIFQVWMILPSTYVVPNLLLPWTPESYDTLINIINNRSQCQRFSLKEGSALLRRNPYSRWRGQASTWL